MNISPLTVHCTSLCLDMLQKKEFNQLTRRDISLFYPDVSELIANRIDEWVSNEKVPSAFIHEVTLEVLSILQSCRKNAQYRQANWIMSELERKLHFPMSMRSIH